MDSRLYVTLARTLVTEVQGRTPPTGAAECRCAISRAYYGAYNVAVDLLDMIGFRTENVGACHVNVQHVLNNSGNADLAAASSGLGTLYVERRHADYEMKNTRPESAAQADAMVKLAESVVQLIVTIRNNTSGLGPIITAVAAYVATSSPAGVKRK
jgi:hypothetical protein